MENKKPLLSIILASYNHAKYISDAIKSFLNQSFQDFEIIIIDDASSDNSIEIIKSFDDKRITLIALEKNLGVSNAVNTGINLAKGKYIKLCASDDIMLPSLLKIQIDFLEKNPDYGVVFCGMEVIDEENNILHKKTKRFEKFFTSPNKTREEWLNYFFFKGNCLGAPTMMMRNDLMKEIAGFNPRLPQAHDFDMWVRSCMHDLNIYILDQKLVQYRRISNNANMSANTAKVRKRLIFDNEKILENYLKITDIDELKRIFPDLKNEKIDQDLIPFFIANQALKVVGSDYHTQFALNTIYKILENPEIREKLEKEHNFTINKNFFAIIEKNPIGVMNEEIQNNFCNKLIKKVKKIFKCK